MKISLLLFPHRKSSHTHIHTQRAYNAVHNVYVIHTHTHTCVRNSGVKVIIG